MARQVREEVGPQVWRFFYIIVVHIAMELKHGLCVCSDAVRYQKKLKVQLNMRDKQIGQARSGQY